MTTNARRALVAPALLGVVACAMCACGDGSSDADELQPIVPMTVDGDCDDGLVTSLSSWGAAGFNGVVAIDAPEDRCLIGVGTVAPEDARTVDGATVFAIGSVSKAFTAAAVLQLVAEGTLSLDDPVAEYVDGISGPIAAASIESLLLHTSGLVGSHGHDHEPLTRDDAVATISELDVDRSAQGEFLYSNAGYTLLALVLEGATQLPFRDYMTTRVLPAGAGFWDGDPAPTGIRAIGVVNGTPTMQTGRFDGPHWAIQGNGDLAMSVDALALWARRLFTGDVVPEPALERIERSSIEADGQGVTAGWVLLRPDRFGEPVMAVAGGGGDVGHNVVVAWLPETRRAIVVASSTDVVSAEELLLALGPAIVRGDDVPVPDTPIEVDPASLERAAGEYAAGAESRFEVSIRGDSLIVVPGGADAFQVLGLTLGRDPADVDAHERAVARLLTGETAPGADELATLEDDLGTLRAARVLGSSVEDRELRTYVELTFDDSSVIGWYALNSAGGIEGVDLAGPPQVELVATADGYRVRSQPAGDDAVVVTFDDQAMTIRSGGRPTVVATRR